MGEQADPKEQRPEWEGRFQKVDDLQELAAMEEVEEPSFTIAGRYEVMATLGQGGMGVIYRAHDTRLDRTVAIKAILPQILSGKQASQRFFREAQALARLNHPNILTLHDYGQDGDLHYLVMELGGRDLGRILQATGGPLSLEQALHAARSACRALEYAHGHGVVHRDLKPANILVGTAEEPGWSTEVSSTPVKVMDFGLAKVRGASKITGPSARLGSPQYMSAEQALGREADERSDLYALGVVLYEICTGVRPFDSDDPEAILSQHLNLAPVPPSAFNAEIPQALEVLILRLLEKDPSRRPASAGEVLRSLEAVSPVASTIIPASGVSTGPSPLGILPARTPLVGRARELEYLKSQYESVMAGGGGRLILVSGEPGVGKTRLIRELGTYARIRGGLYLEGRYLKGITVPYGPWEEALRDAIHGLGKEQLAQVVGPYGAELSQISPEFVDHLGSFPPPPALGPEDMRLRLFDGIASLISNLSQIKPLVLFIDDYQWAQGMTLLAHVARYVKDSRVLLVGAYREQEFNEQPSLLQDWAELNRARLFTQLNLSPLDEEGTAQMVAHHFGNDAAAKLRERIHAMARGNPFFIEEVVRSLAESGAARPADGGWEVADPSGVGIPRSVKLAIEERVARLGDAAKEVLTQASVLGQVFSFPSLLAMIGWQEANLVTEIERAQAARLLVDKSIPGDERYGFTDDHVQEVLYSSITTSRRRRYHLRAGQALEALYVDRLEARMEELSRHFTEGNDPEKGADYSYRAGLKADRLYGWKHSIPFYKTALGLWEQMGGHLEERARVCEMLGNVSFKAAADIQEATGYFFQSLALYEEMGNRHKMATIHSQLAREYGLGGNVVLADGEKALEHLHLARTILEGEPEGPALGFVYGLLAVVSHQLLQLQESISWAQKAVEVGEKLKRPAIVAQACAPLGWALVLAGETGEGLRTLEHGWRLSSENNLAIPTDVNRFYGLASWVLLKSPKAGREWGARKPDYRSIYSLIHVRSAEIAACALQGDLEKGNALLGEFQRTLETLGQPPFGPMPSDPGLLLLRRGDWSKALSLLQNGFLWATASKMQLKAALTARVLGEVCFELGHYSRSEELLLQALDITRSGRSVTTLPSLLACLCELYLHSGELQKAQAYLAEAQAMLAKSQDWHGLPGDLYLAEGMARAAEGRWAEADAAFREAVEVDQRYELCWDEAKVYYEWACTLLSKGDEGARECALELLNQAIALWDPMGALPYAERCRVKLAEVR